MSHPRLLKVTCCGPRDVEKELNIVGEIADEWNIQHGDGLNTFLKHQYWKTDSSPDLSERPQGVLNRQLIDGADIIIAVFWSRFGTPTGLADSGTEEEILRAIKSKKRVLLYFSDLEPLPAGTEQKQLRSVEAFRSKMASTGVYWSFNSRTYFKDSLRTHLAKAIHELLATKGSQEEPARAKTVISQKGNGIQIVGDHNASTINIRQGATRGSQARTFPANSIGADANLTNYVEYLCGLYVDFMKPLESDPKVSWAKIGKQIKTKFRLNKRTRHHLSKDRFPDLVEFLIEEKLARTPVGAKHLRRGTRLCRSYEEYTTGQM